jgi:predicted transcriptional regulator
VYLVSTFMLQYKANLDFKFFIQQCKIHMSAYLSPREKVITPISVLDKREQKRKLKNEKRHKLELFYTIICAIDEETIMTGVARPTRIQHHSMLSYDKMINHFTELEEKGMIQRTTGRVVSITVKGREFVSQYDRLMRLMESADL